MRERKPGVWGIQWYVRRDEATGKKVYGTATVRGGKKDAQKELNKRIRNVETGDYVDPTKTTVGSYLH